MMERTNARCRIKIGRENRALLAALHWTAQQNVRGRGRTGELRQVLVADSHLPVFDESESGFYPKRPDALSGYHNVDFGDRWVIAEQLEEYFESVFCPLAAFEAKGHRSATGGSGGIHCCDDRFRVHGLLFPDIFSGALSRHERCADNME